MIHFSKILMNAKVIAVSLSTAHSFSKANQESIKLLAGLSVEGIRAIGFFAS